MLDAQMAKVSTQAFEKAKELAAERLHRTKQQYIDSLTVQKVGPNVYVVRLDADAVHLEEGYGRYDMKPGLLGLNSGTNKPGVKTSKKGYKYRVIPFDQSGGAAKKDSPLHNTIMQKDRSPDALLGDPGRTGKETKMGDFATQFNALKKRANDIAKHVLPQDFKGRAWTIEKDNFNSQKANVRFGNGQTMKMNMGQKIHENLFGLTNVRAPKEHGGKGVRSAYMTFRVVSENPAQAGKWWHPGFQGVHIIPDVQKWTEETFATIAEAIFRKAS